MERFTHASLTHPPRGPWSQGQSGLPGVIQPKFRPNVRAHTTAGACLQGLATGFLKLLCQILSDNVFLLPHLPSTKRKCLDILEHLNQAFLHLFWDIISVHFISFKTPAGRSQVAPAKLMIATELFTWPHSTARVHLVPRKCPLYRWEVPQCPSLCAPSGHAISSPFFTETLFLSSGSTLWPSYWPSRCSVLWLPTVSPLPQTLCSSQPCLISRPAAAPPPRMPRCVCVNDFPEHITWFL